MLFFKSIASVGGVPHYLGSGRDANIRKGALRSWVCLKQALGRAVLWREHTPEEQYTSFSDHIFATIIHEVNIFLSGKFRNQLFAAPAQKFA